MDGGKPKNELQFGHRLQVVDEVPCRLQYRPSTLLARKPHFFNYEAGLELTLSAMGYRIRVPPMLHSIPIWSTAEVHHVDCAAFGTRFHLTLRAYLSAANILQINGDGRKGRRPKDEERVMIHGWVLGACSRYVVALSTLTSYQQLCIPLVTHYRPVLQNLFRLRQGVNSATQKRHIVAHNEQGESSFP